MNQKDNKYYQFSLCREMIETIQIINNFNPEQANHFSDSINRKEGLFLTGEGSSRIFPAKRTIFTARKNGINTIITDGAAQALEYNLSDYTVFGASNSGKTSEIIRLFKKLKRDKHDAFFGVTANSATPLEQLAIKSHLLSCGRENAVAATKSVIEQCLFYDAFLHLLVNQNMPDLKMAGRCFKHALEQVIDTGLIEKAAKADTIYFAGRNNGVAEELTLKTNEITRKKSDYLEETYAVHGIEEVMIPPEVVIIIDPFKEEEEKFHQVLVKGVGLTVIAIASRQTRFPTIIIPDCGYYKNYVEMAAGWNFLVEIGIFLGIDMDRPQRARKVGNEYKI